MNAVAQKDGTIYIGGDFAYVGPATGNAVALDAGTGIAVGVPMVDGTVRAIAPDGAGGWYIGGTFTSVAGVARSRIAHLRADYTLSPWNPGANNIVNVLWVSGSKVYAVGGFTNIGGQARNRIAALDAVTGSVSRPFRDGEPRRRGLRRNRAYVRAVTAHPGILVVRDSSLPHRRASVYDVGGCLVRSRSALSRIGRPWRSSSAGSRSAVP